MLYYYIFFLKLKNIFVICLDISKAKNHNPINDNKRESYKTNFLEKRNYSRQICVIKHMISQRQKTQLSFKFL